MRSLASFPENLEPIPKAAKKDQTSLSAQGVDKLSLQQKSEYDRLFGELFFFRTGIPSPIVERDAMKNFMRLIRPAYWSQMPNRNFLSGNLLDVAYDKLNKKLAGALPDCRYYSIVFDAWSIV